MFRFASVCHGVCGLFVVPALLMATLIIAGLPVAAQQGDANQKGDAKQKGDNKSKPGEKATPPKTTPPKSGNSKETVRDEILNADGWPIHITYFESLQGKESPVAVLIASAEGPDSKDSRNRRIWVPTAQGLQRAGYAVVTVDLRKHGDSLPAAGDGEAPKVKMANTDYLEMAGRDLEAVKLFLAAEHKAEKLNVRKLGIVAMGSSAMVASAFAVSDWAKEPYPDAPTLELRTPRGQDVRALVLYSPNASVKGINSATVLKAMKGLQIAVYVVASKDNKLDAKSAEKIYSGIELKGEEFAEVRKLVLAPGETHAEGFIEGRFAEATNKDILDFLNKHVKDLDFPWVSRQDRRTK
jgi:pimeloyl-ACP methyl ester carboxylesterase